VQEALDKLDTPRPAGDVHLVGHLQRNKAKHVAGRFALIHSLDSAELADELDKRAGGAAHGAKQRVLLQVNVRAKRRRALRAGRRPRLAHRIAAQPHLALEGLMTIAPFTDDQDVQRRRSGTCAYCGTACRRRAYGCDALDGDVRDYGVAVEEGQR